MSRQPTAESFLKDVHNHEMRILHHEGIYRHVRYRKPGDSNMWFELVTWPEHLTIAGDMGTWTFSRVEDMFTFFRDEQLRINESYWAEKLQGGNCSGSRTGAIEFHADTFRKSLFADLKNYNLTPKQRNFVSKELHEALESCDENEHAMYTVACGFDCEIPGYGRFSFDGADLPDGEIYTYRFVWCLYAIVWAIQKWDAAMDSEKSETAAIMA